MSGDYGSDRFRSFAERYIIERARNWPSDGKDGERAWEALLDARRIYTQIKEQAKVNHPDAEVGGATQRQPPTTGPIGKGVSLGPGMNMVPVPRSALAKLLK